MGKRYKGPFKKGDLVYTRVSYGDNRGQIDQDRKYTIRAIGPTQAVLDRHDEDKEQPRYRMRGTTYRLTPKEACERRNGGDGYGWYYWDWSQVFVKIGDAGWDPDMNY